MEELLLFWGHSDAAHPACICQGVANSSLSKHAAGCLGRLVLPCSASRETVLSLMSFLHLLDLAGKEVAYS